MRLSKLHIAGFKSFPDRAELGFDHGVTAIVGPNGCGKSNVVDAITWVLGEQSAKSLRGERMEDVIFNGSDARKPTATAEVRLKLTHVAQAATLTPRVELEELLEATPLITRDIEIGRRLYRSGESEYLIDGEVRRLRDVHDLLMDSGLGVKAYAVIEQGKIGQILASRPAERRMLIEEAAGVTKYKSRRRAAELKLEAAQQNLTRIDDIVFEVEKQRGALKRQAARARRYRRLREELRKWEQVQFARRFAALSRDIAAAGARLDEARAREAAAAAHVAELDAALEALRLGLTDAEGRATSAREEAHARELEIGRRQQQMAFDRQQIEELARQAAAFDEEARELEARRGPAAALLAAQREAILGARHSLHDAHARVADREAEYARAQAAVQTIEREADTMRAAVLSAETTLSALEQARENARAMRDRVAAERERLEIEARELVGEVERARRSHDDVAASLADARARLERTSAERSAADAAVAAARSDRDALLQDVAAGERLVAAAGGRLRSLEALEASRATFGDAARLLLSDGGAAVPHHGAIADHLNVDRSYERAIDALLGDLLQHVLVDSSADVERALAFLAARDAGRCGFLVLDAVERERDSSPLVVPAGARAVTDVARASGPYARAIERALGRALIVEGFEAARQVSAAVSIPVASTNGEVFHGAWLVEGGSRQDARGILETRAETIALREELAESTAELSRLRERLRAVEAILETAEASSSAVAITLHDQEKTIVGLEAQASRAGDDHARISRRLSVVETDRARSEEEQKTAERRRDEATAAIDEHHVRRREAEESLAGVLARLQTARHESEARMRLVTESRTEQATLIERMSGFEAEVARLDEAGRELEERIAGRRTSIRRTEERRDDLSASIRATEAGLDDDVRVLERLRTEMRELDQRVSELRQQFHGADQNIRAARHTLDGVRAEVTQAEVARATAAADLVHLESTCVDAVGAPLDDVVANVARMEDAGELKAPAGLSVGAAEDEDEGEGDDTASSGAAVAAQAAEVPSEDADPDRIALDLRRKIERLGPVNMMAIEQFDDLEARHTFLTTQRKDLLDSISQTGEAIRKIDKTTKERFAEAFEVINRHFETTFTTLFGGGRAGLVLIDQENENESGIDIIAQPPGKRLQNVQLLSGGEKALTAMALMFAVFKYRPSPFCLLDEIDAPLDDANIGRFVDMLQGMQEHTQFILITHNRKTMEIADRLYGVTMEEPGVSKLISVQLN